MNTGVILTFNINNTLQYYTMRKKQFNKRKINPGTGKIEINRDGHRTGLIIRNEYWKLIQDSPYSASKLLDIALTAYFKDEFKLRLNNTIHMIYEDLFMLEKLKDLGKMGMTEFTIEHQLQIESYVEVARILENSPLFEEE